MELRDYLNVIRVRKWIIIYAVVIVTATAVVSSMLQTPVYSSTAKVLVTTRPMEFLASAVYGGYLPPERVHSTEIELMTLRVIGERVVRRLDLQAPPAAVTGRASVQPVGQTDIVAITVTDPDSERAAAIANAIAEEYVLWSRETKREATKRAADEVERRLDEAKDELYALGEQIKESGRSDELQAELQMAAGLFTTLTQRLEQLRVNEELETGAGRVVETALPGQAPISPNPRRNGVLGLAVGLVFGLGLALLNEYLDNTIKSTEEAERVLGAPVLGMIPLEKFEKGEKRRLTILQHPGSPAAEAYRAVRNALDFINFEHDIKTLLVASAAPSEGKSTVAANLAVSLAQAGKKVALVSCDFRRPMTEVFFGVQNLIGLSDVLLGAHSIKAAMQRSGDEHLLIMTSGKMPPNPSELLGSQKMKDLLDEIGEWADWVILDTPPLLAVADAAAVARWCDGVLLVTRAGVSTRDAANKGVGMLEKVGARIVGSIVWGLDTSTAGSGYYAGYYGQYYYADYYLTPEDDREAGRKPRRGTRARKQPKAVVSQEGLPRAEIYVPRMSPMRRFLMLLGRLMAGVLGLLAALVIAGMVTYFLDQYFGWGLLEMVTITLS